VHQEESWGKWSNLLAIRLMLGMHVTRCVSNIEIHQKALARSQEITKIHTNMINHPCPQPPPVLQLLLSISLLCLPPCSYLIQGCLQNCKILECMATNGY
jgi:hypothetical protein